MKNYPIHVTWAQGKTLNTLCITWGSKLSFMRLKSDAKFEGKLACILENDMRNLEQFQQSTQKCQNWDFGGIL